MTAGPAVEELEREVSATAAEFVQALRNAFPEGMDGGPLDFRVRRGEVALEIAVRPGPDRVIALLRLPTLRVRIRLSGADRAARARLLRHLDLATHRGGG